MQAENNNYVTHFAKKKNEQKQVLRVQKHSLRDEAYLDAVKMPL